MSDDLIKREDAIDAIECVTWYHQNRNKDMVSGANSDEHQAWYKAEDIYDALEAVPSADRPQDDDWEKYSDKLWKNAYERGKADGAMIYGNEHNCIMTIFGECSYAETGCGDCAVVEKVRKALSADRPQGEWIDAEIPLESGGSMPIQACNLCKTFYPLAYTGGGHRFCPNCGARMKGTDDESTL